MMSNSAGEILAADSIPMGQIELVSRHTSGQEVRSRLGHPTLAIRLEADNVVSIFTTPKVVSIAIKDDSLARSGRWSVHVGFRVLYQLKQTLASLNNRHLNRSVVRARSRPP
jgi:hypothetical protein